MTQKFSSAFVDAFHRQYCCCCWNLLEFTIGKHDILVLFNNGSLYLLKSDGTHD